MVVFGPVITGSLGREIPPKNENGRTPLYLTSTLAFEFRLFAKRSNRLKPFSSWPSLLFVLPFLFGRHQRDLLEAIDGRRLLSDESPSRRRLIRLTTAGSGGHRISPVGSTFTERPWPSTLRSKISTAPSKKKRLRCRNWIP